MTNYLFSASLIMTSLFLTDDATAGRRHRQDFNTCGQCSPCVSSATCAVYSPCGGCTSSTCAQIESTYTVCVPYQEQRTATRTVNVTRTEDESEPLKITTVRQISDVEGLSLVELSDGRQMLLQTQSLTPAQQTQLGTIGTDVDEIRKSVGDRINPAEQAAIIDAVQGKDPGPIQAK